MYRKYKFNENYFKEVNTPNKAYFLGLLYADGSMSNKKSSCAIKLKEEDKHILEEFKNDIGIDKPLYYRKSELVKGTKYIGKAQYKLELCSEELTKDLKKLGVVPNKGDSIRFPKEDVVPKKYIKDFIRGWFDGDGCIYTSQNRIMLNLVSNELFLKSFSEFLTKELNINTKYKKDKRSNSWYLFIMKIKDVIKFCEYIYEDSNCIKLTRKYEKFKNYMKLKEEVLKQKEII